MNCSPRTLGKLVRYSGICSLFVFANGLKCFLVLSGVRPSPVLFVSSVCVAIVFVFVSVGLCGVSIFFLFCALCRFVMGMLFVSRSGLPLVVMYTFDVDGFCVICFGR